MSAASTTPQQEIGQTAPPPVLARLGTWIRTNPLLHAIVIGALVVALAAVGIGTTVERRRAEQRAAEARAALIHDAEAALTAQASALLKLSALPLGWAFRSALLTNDIATVDTYVGRIVQEPNVTSVALADAGGTITHSSNDKLRGRPVHEAFPQVSIDGHSPQAVATAKDVRIVVPVMGYDRRLGTLIFSYAQRSATGSVTSGHAR